MALASAWAGTRLYVPAATVIHFDGASSCQAAETVYAQLDRSKVQFYRRQRFVASTEETVQTRRPLPDELS